MITINDTHRLEDYGMKATNDFEDPITFPFSANTNRVARSDKIYFNKRKRRAATFTNTNSSRRKNAPGV